MINRAPTSEEKLLNICGSSTFGRYPKISIEKSYNIFLSDTFMVNYPGYKVAISASRFGNATEGRGCYASVKLNKMVAVMGDTVYIFNITFNQRQKTFSFSNPTSIGTLQTSTGIVWITENNKPQLGISDGKHIYIYDPAVSASLIIATKNGTDPISFVPGYLDFHDTYFLCAASLDSFEGNQSNTWRLSGLNDGATWPDDAASVGLLQTKGDNTQAVVRVPSKGNLIFVFGKTVVEPWYDVGYKLFPYSRSTAFNLDYGCLNPATIAAMDTVVVWLGVNEKGGPSVMYSDGGKPIPITTDGFDYVLSNLQFPEDSQAFIYRQDGHVFYHINFYADNLSFFVDFLKDGTNKIYHACDENNNYFIASSVAFINNQYYFTTRNNGNFYSLDTIFETYAGAEIPRIRVCQHVRNQKQEPFLATDCGFTIESGNTNYHDVEQGPLYFITEDGKKLITEGDPIFFITEDGKLMITESGDNLASQQVDDTSYEFLIDERADFAHLTPSVSLSISIDGGEHFSSYDTQYLPPIGQRKNKLQWWQLGWSNDLVCQFRFQGLGRFAATDGTVNIRQ